MPTPEQAARLGVTDPQELGARIRDHRLAAGCGQAELAAAVGVSISYVSRIEAGKRRCDVTLLSKLATALHVGIDDLLGSNSPAASSQPGSRPSTELEFARVALELGEAQTALDQLDELQVDTPDPRRRDWLLLRARALEALGQVAAAIGDLERIPVPSGDQDGDVEVAITLSRCYREAGEFVRAIRTGEETLERFATAGLEGTDDAVQLAVTVAAAYFEQGDRNYAIRLCRRTVDAAEALGTSRARASAYWNFAIMDLERGNADDAVLLARKAYALLSEGQDDRNLARLQAELGLMELRLTPPDLDEAERHFSRAYAGFAASSAGASDIQRLAASRAKLALLSGDASGALEQAEELVRLQAGRFPQLEAEALVVAGEASVTLKDADSARRYYLSAVQALARVDNVRGVAQLWLDLGARLQVLGEIASAAEAFERAAIAAGLTVPTIAKAPSSDRAALSDRTQGP